MRGLRLSTCFAVPLLALVVAGACWADTPDEGTIAWAKSFTDGTTLPATLTDKVVSRVFPDLGYYYAQEPGRTCGIRVYDPTIVFDLIPGAIVSIDGEITTDAGERVINASYTTYPESYASIKPLGLTCRGLGGARLNAQTQGAAGACGLNNVGLLVRVWGQVTCLGDGYLYIDDGSGCTDGTRASGADVMGVRVVGTLAFAPKVGDKIGVTGISGLASYAGGCGRTIRLADASDATEISPTRPPSGLVATPSGGGTILLCWNQVPGAAGYNVYRGTVAGEENYTSPINGSTPVTTRCFDGSDRFTYTDSGLATDSEFFYTVKAVSACGESRPSDEARGVTSASAIPWATRNPAAIVSAALSRSPVAITCPVDVIGPDATVYTSEGDVILPPVLGSYGPMPVEVNRALQLNPPAYERDNAHSGPYRKVETYKNYWRENGYAVLPPVLAHINVSPTTYAPGMIRMSKGEPVPCTTSADIPFVYLGSAGADNQDVCAGLRFEPSDGKWNMFIRVANSSLFWIFDPNPPAGFDGEEYPTPLNNQRWLDIPSNSTVFLDYWCGNDGSQHTLKSGVWFRATGETGERAVFVEVDGHPRNGMGVSMKRVSMLAQFLPINAPQGGLSPYDKGYIKTGSYFLESEWSGITIYDMTRAWDVDAIHAKYKQEFPYSEENVVTFFADYPYYSERYINLDLRY